MGVTPDDKSVADEPLLSAHQMTVATSSGATLLSQCSLSVREGEIITVLGASGAGKSTMLRALVGLTPLERGEVWLRGRCVSARGLTVSPDLRLIGYVSQGSPLFPHLTVWDNILFGVVTTPHKLRASRAETISSQRLEELETLLELLEISNLKSRRPQSLSGGQRRRVSLARALALDVDLYLLDEPLSHLDPALRGRVAARLVHLLRARKRAVVWVSHDPAMALRYADRVVVLDQGSLVSTAAPQTLMRTPPTRATSDLLGVITWTPLSAWGIKESTDSDVGLTRDRTGEDIEERTLLRRELGFHHSCWRLNEVTSRGGVGRSHETRSSREALMMNQDDVSAKEEVARDMPSLTRGISEILAHAQLAQRRYQCESLTAQTPVMASARVEEVELTDSCLRLSFTVLRDTLHEPNPSLLPQSVRAPLILVAYLTTYSDVRRGDLITMTYAGPLFLHDKVR